MSAVAHYSYTHGATLIYILPFLVGIGIMLYFMCDAIASSIQYERDRKNPNLVWSRANQKYVERFSDDHIGEALFWGNLVIERSTLGMNGVPD